MEASGGARQDEQHRQVAERAYLIYLARGASDGADLEDWLQAEMDLGLAQPESATAQAWAEHAVPEQQPVPDEQAIPMHAATAQDVSSPEIEEQPRV
jgi:hypothetical protein